MRGPRRTPPLLWLLTSLMLVAATACGGSGGSAGNASGGDKGTITVRVASNSNAAVLPAWVADEKGIFAKNGLKVTFTDIENISTLPATAGRSFDIVLSTPTLLASAASQGISVVEVAGADVDTKDNSYAGVFVRKGSGIRSPRDLAGKRIGVLTVAGTQHLATKYWVKQDGGDPNSLNAVQVNGPNMADQLSSGRVDAVETVQPFTASVRATGAPLLGDSFLSIADTIPGIVWIADSDWAKKNTEAIDRFIRSLDAGRDYIESNDAAARQVLGKHSNLPPAALKSLPFPTYTTDLHADGVAKWVSIMREFGILKKPVDPKSLVFSATQGSG